MGVGAIKPGAGKTKGAAYERAVGKILSNWLTCGNRGDLFSRNVLSGGKFTISRKAGKREGVSGDLMATHAVSFRLLALLSIEIKHYANLGWEPFFYDRKRKSFIWQTITHTKDQAEHAGLHWLIIAKQNMKPPLAIMSIALADIAIEHMRSLHGLRKHVLHNGAAVVIDLNSFLQVKPKAFMRALEERKRRGP